MHHIQDPQSSRQVALQLSNRIVCVVLSENCDSSTNISILCYPLYGALWAVQLERQIYRAIVHHIIGSHQNYHVYHCFPQFPRGQYGECFVDIVWEDNFTTLLSSYFWWLINIRPNHLIFWQGRHYWIEPSLPVDLHDSLVMISFIWAILTLNCIATTI